MQIFELGRAWARRASELEENSRLLLIEAKANADIFVKLVMSEFQAG